ncbi:MAG: protoporphyrinogen oxidase [Thermoplasmatota archaeon]
MAASPRYDVIVVGAGISGLVAAETLVSHGRDVLCLEESGIVGGQLGTTHRDGYLFEHAAHGVLARVEAPATSKTAEKPAADGDEGSGFLGLLEWLTIEPVIGRSESHTRNVVHKGRLVPVPSGPLGLLKTPLLSWNGRMRVVRERKVPPLSGREESVADFAVRRFGEEARPLADAFVTGIFAGDPSRLSLDAAFPGGRRMEATSGSLLRGMGAARGGGRRELVAPARGMGDLVDQLAARVKPRTGHGLKEIRRSDGAIRVETDRESFDAHAVICANGLAAAGPLHAEWPTVRRAPIAVAGLGFRAADIARISRLGYGFVAPEAEGRFVLGVLVESNVFAGRAPEGHVLLRALVGGMRHPERAALSDSALIEGVRSDLANLGITSARPVWSVVRRPKDSRGTIPQIEMGHSRVWDAIAESEAKNPGVIVIGAGIRSVAVGDLVAEARAAANRLTPRLG